MEAPESSRNSVYLPCWYNKSAQCTCFTGTKVQILTHWKPQHNEEYLSPAILEKYLLCTNTDALWKLQHNEEYLSPAILEKLRQVESEEGSVEASLKVSLREAVQRTLDIWY